MKHIKEFFDVNKPDKTKNKKRSTPGKYHTPNKPKHTNTHIENTYGYNKQDKTDYITTLSNDELDKQIYNDADNLHETIQDVQDQLRLHNVDNNPYYLNQDTGTIIYQLEEIKKNIDNHIDNITYFNDLLSLSLNEYDNRNDN